MNNRVVTVRCFVAEELYGDFEDLETGVVHKGRPATEGDEVWPFSLFWSSTYVFLIK